MTTLWKSHEVLKATKGDIIGSKFWKANGISIDTRSILPGNIFLAIEGENKDGHNFVLEAFKKGACAAIVSKEIQNIENNNYILVKNTLDSLRHLAIFSRNRTKISF